MLAASGHRTVAVDATLLTASSVRRLVEALNLTGVVLVAPAYAEKQCSLLDGDFLETLDGAVFIAPRIEPPISTKTIVIVEPASKLVMPASSNVQRIVVEAPLVNGNQERFMQIIANFLDFVHPR